MSAERASVLLFFRISKRGIEIATAFEAGRAARPRAGRAARLRP